ncbi:ATP-binding cassette domain-containing protein [Nonomuraea wenchangensis]
MHSPDQTLTAKGLTKRFGPRKAVSGISFEVGAGRAFGLLGPNGTGKTTVVRLLTGMLTPTHGSVTLSGQRLDRANGDALRSRIGVQTTMTGACGAAAVMVCSHASIPEVPPDTTIVATAILLKPSRNRSGTTWLPDAS